MWNRSGICLGIDRLFARGLTSSWRSGDRPHAPLKDAHLTANPQILLGASHALRCNDSRVRNELLVPGRQAGSVGIQHAKN